MNSPKAKRQLNGPARATVVNMALGSLAFLAFLAAIILLLLHTSAPMATLGVVIGAVASVALLGILLVTVSRRVRVARDTRLAELRRREPNALVVHTEWNAALQGPFVRREVLPANVDSRGFDMELTADGEGVRLWLGTLHLPLIGEIAWRQVASIEPTEVHAAIGSHRVPALRVQTIDSSSFLPTIELIYRGHDIQDLCDRLNALRGDQRHL